MRTLFSIVTIFLISPFLYAQDQAQDGTGFSMGGTSSNFFHYTLWDIILAVLVVFGFIFTYFLARYASGLQSDIKRVGKDRSIGMPLQAESSNSKIEKLENEIRQVRNLVRDSKEQQLVQEKRGYEEKPIEVEFMLSPKPAGEIFYMATPSGEKSFDISAKTETFKATQSLYKFTVDSVNNNHATFIFQSDETGISDSVNSPHIYIEPVCDPQNALNQNAKRITTIRPGTAEKRNDKWMVLTKAQIKYE